MRELERESPPDTPAYTRLVIVGQGRVGTALHDALQGTAFDLVGPLGRGADGRGADVVLLAVPDSEIGPASQAIAAGPLVGHCSGATGLEVLAPHEAFSIHPLMTITEARAPLSGAGAAIAGATPRALSTARRIATALRMRPVEVGAADRTAYHAAASIASNFFVTLEAAAERLAATAGIDRELLVPLVRATVENWAELGPEQALTGPVARGDEETVEAQREALLQRVPELLPLFEELVSATRDLAGAERMPKAKDPVAA